MPRLTPSYESADQLIRNLRTKPDLEATKALTKFYATARFGIAEAAFEVQYTDGADDDGVDFYSVQDGTYTSIQTKFSGSPRTVRSNEVKAELTKTFNALSGTHQNRRADIFFNSARTDLSNPDRLLELVFLTSNRSNDGQRKSLQDWVLRERRRRRWSIQVDFVLIDKSTINMVCYDVQHGFVPHTGRVRLAIQREGRIEHRSEDTSMLSIVATAKISDLLGWIRGHDLSIYLEKNVRGFKGENKVNREIRSSYESQAETFWFKHNGVVIFADSINTEDDGWTLVLRNPQIVNGGQTVRTLYSAFVAKGRRDNGSTILVRVYRLPYDDTNAYHQSVDIIKALNFQTKIQDSDLRSNDRRQVRIEQIMRELSVFYVRKLDRGMHAALDHVVMRDLGMRYLLCKRQAPDLGVSGAVEAVFGDQNDYDEAFPEREIEKDLSPRHIVVKYITLWIVDRYLQRLTQLPARSAQYHKFTKFYVLAEAFPVIWEYARARFDNPVEWRDYLESPSFRNYFESYARDAFARARAILPRNAEAIDFYKTDVAVRRFSTRSRTARLRRALERSYRAFSSTY